MNIRSQCFDNARKLIDKTNSVPYLEEIIDNFVCNQIVHEGAIRHLLDRKNWVTECLPRIVIVANNNQVGNLTVRWYPGSKNNPQLGYRVNNFCNSDEHGFDQIFINECSLSESMSSRRPLNEFMWIKNFIKIQNVYQEDDPYVKEQIAMGVKDVYDGLVCFLKKELDVLHATELILNYYDNKFCGLKLSNKHG